MGKAESDILVVDDNVDAAESIQELLGLWGHEATLAFGGLAAVELYRSHPYQLVFMDLKMPDLDGREASRQILAINPKVRIVLITGNAVEEEIGAVMELPIYKLFRKPFDPFDLEQLMKEVSS